MSNHCRLCVKPINLGRWPIHYHIACGTGFFPWDLLNFRFVVTRCNVMHGKYTRTKWLFSRVMNVQNIIRSTVSTTRNWIVVFSSSSPIVISFLFDCWFGRVSIASVASSSSDLSTSASCCCCHCSRACERASRWLLWLLDAAKTQFTACLPSAL